MSKREEALEDYIQVNERIQEFYKKYPEGSIQTDMVSNENGHVIFKAYAYKNMEDTKPCIGHAMEKEGSNFINKTSHIENCETSAVGRALANLGLLVNKSIASYEEVANAQLNQKKTEKTTQTVTNSNELISTPQAKRLFAIAGGNEGIIKEILKNFGYEKSLEIKRADYDAISKKIEAKAKEVKA